MIFGEALVHAYDLESTIVKYPRIMVHSQVLTCLTDDVVGLSCKSNVLASEDGPLYLHALSRMNYDLVASANGPYKDATAPQRYLDIKSKLHGRYLDALDNPAHFEKVKWFVAYWNRSLPTLAPEYRIDAPRSV